MSHNNLDLIIDAGNSSIRYAVYDNGSLLKKYKIKRGSVLKYLALRELDHYYFNRGIYSNVGNEENDKGQFKVKNWINFNHKTPLPIKNLYNSPSTLGLDRLAAACGVNNQKTYNTLVIDAGTCITYDFLDSQNQFWGGSISPGIDMRYKALNNFTAALPLPINGQYNGFNSLFGRNTKESILCGVQRGIIDEFDGRINDFKMKYKQLQVIVCGGSTPFFVKQTKNKIFARPNLVIEGLYKILSFNA